MSLFWPIPEPFWRLLNCFWPISGDLGAIVDPFWHISAGGDYIGPFQLYFSLIPVTLQVVKVPRNHEDGVNNVLHFP